MNLFYTKLLGVVAGAASFHPDWIVCEKSYVSKGGLPSNPFLRMNRTLLWNFIVGLMRSFMKVYQFLERMRPDIIWVTYSMIRRGFKLI